MKRILSLETTANLALFLSALLLLLNWVPTDYLPPYSGEKAAYQHLASDENIVADLYNGSHIQAPKMTDTGLRITQSEDDFLALENVIRSHSSLSQTVNWTNVIGAGYSKLSFPVGNFHLDVIEPLYVVELPSDASSTKLVLRPVGQLSDLGSWVDDVHRSDLNFIALLLLVFGFAAQLWLGATKRADHSS